MGLGHKGIQYATYPLWFSRLRLSRSVMMSPKIACGVTENPIDLLFEGIPTSKGVISTYHKVMGAHANVLARG